MTQRRTQLSVMAVAALAIVALAAVMLLASGVPAQAGSMPATHESATDAPPQPQQTAPEACAESPVPVYGGAAGAKRLALFDVYWDTAQKNLFNNPCPPTVSHHPAQYDDRDELLSPARDVRDASDVDVRETIIHIPNGYRRTLAVNSSDDITRFPFLYEDALGANGQPVSDTNPADGAKDTPVSDAVWILPTCDPSYTDAQNAANPARAGAEDLCLIFSAALLNPDNWVDGPKSPTAGPVQFEFESIREPSISAADRGAAFAFYPHNDIPSGIADDQITWRTDDADTNELLITPGSYEYRQWAFTRPGTYVFELHVKGHPREHDVHGAVIDTRDITTTSEIMHYRIHVGLLAELNTVITASDTTPNVGDTVTLTVTARNEGPDAGTDATVQAVLPEGLTYVSSETATGTYNSETGVWSLGTMAAPAAGVDATAATLTITATVDEGTRGTPLEVTATISATETIGGSTVNELDPHNEHHSARVTITPRAENHTPPMFKVTRSVVENSAADTAVGDIIMVMDPDEGETLAYALEGDGADNFDAAAVDGGVQVSVASGANLDYESAMSYDLKLTVSDGVDHEGNADSSVDHSIGLLVNITDVDEPFTVTLMGDGGNTPTVGQGNFRLVMELHNKPYEHGTLRYRLYEADADGSNSTNSYGLLNPSFPYFGPEIIPTEPKTRQYRLTITEDVDNGGERTLATSNTLLVQWQAASQ